MVWILIYFSEIFVGARATQYSTAKFMWDRDPRNPVVSAPMRSYDVLMLEGRVTGQLADTPTRGLPTRGLVNSRTSQLADWTSRGLDNSRSRRRRQKNEN